MNPHKKETEVDFAASVQEIAQMTRRIRQALSPPERRALIQVLIQLELEDQRGSADAR